MVMPREVEFEKRRECGRGSSESREYVGVVDTQGLC